MKYLAFGEILWDVYPDDKFIGGASLNFAAHLARHKQDVSILSAVGMDSLGELSLKELSNFGVNIQYVNRNADKQTGKCLVTLDENAIPSFDLLDDVAYDYINGDVVKDDFDVLYFGTLALRGSNNLDTLKKLIKRNDYSQIVCDINLRKPFYSKQIVEFAFQTANILKISLEELSEVAALLGIDGCDYKIFCEDAAQKFENVKIFVITLGDGGAYAYDCSEKRGYNSKGNKVEVVSTVGAGDSFFASFIYKLNQGLSIDQCLVYANKIAAFVVSDISAVPEYTIE